MLRRRKDGSQFWAHVVIDPIFDESGAHIGFAKITRDVTEKRKAELELALARSRSLQAQKMEAIGQLTGGIAHDFNNLLTAVRGNLELLERHVASETGRRMLASAMRAADRGGELTSRLLAFSRRQHVEKRTLCLNRLIEGMQEMLGRTLGGTIAIETRLSAELWPAVGDATQLELAILNLAINGRDAMSLGGTLTIATTNVAVTDAGLPRELAHQDYVMVRVTDTGIGMTEQTRLRAFEPFFTTKARDRGTGLGLSMVYALARDSGGTVTLESEVGKGTSVRLYLPRARLTSRAADQAGEGPALDAGPASRLLLVDDDDDVREVTALMLKGFGHEVVQVDSGAAALETLATDPRFDALVVDLAMPNMHGSVFAVRARAVVPGIPALFVTGYADPHWLRDVSPEHLLRKPFSRLDLAAKLRQLLAGPGSRSGDPTRGAPTLRHPADPSREA
jgi:signal transduction histidine kinase/CheY-like chemotaxis protein